MQPKIDDPTRLSKIDYLENRQPKSRGQCLSKVSSKQHESSDEEQLKYYYDFLVTLSDNDVPGSERVEPISFPFENLIYSVAGVESRVYSRHLFLALQEDSKRVACKQLIWPMPCLALFQPKAFNRAELILDGIIHVFVAPIHTPQKRKMLLIVGHVQYSSDCPVTHQDWLHAATRFMALLRAQANTQEADLGSFCLASYSCHQPANLQSKVVKTVWIWSLGSRKLWSLEIVAQTLCAFHLQEGNLCTPS